MEKVEKYNVLLEINGKVLKNFCTQIDAINTEEAKIIAELQFPESKAIRATKM